MYIYIYMHGLQKCVFSECALFQFWAKPDSYYSCSIVLRSNTQVFLKTCVLSSKSMC